MASRRNADWSAGSSSSSNAVRLASKASRGSVGKSVFIGNSQLTRGSWHNSVPRQFHRNCFHGVMKDVTDITNAQSGAFGDFFVGESFFEFQTNELAAASF